MLIILKFPLKPIIVYLKLLTVKYILLIPHFSSNYNYSGVYKFLCSSNKLYMGKINRNFNIRYKEHTNKIEYNKSNPKLNFAKHILNNNHPIHFNVEKV